MNYLADIKVQIKENPIMFWKLIKSKKENSDSPKLMKRGDFVSHDEQEICDMFGDFFQSVYRTDTSDVL